MSTLKSDKKLLAIQAKKSAWAMRALFLEKNGASSRPLYTKKERNVGANPNLFSIWKIMEIYTLYEHKFSATSREDKKHI